jgi:hypothetical protein
VLGTLVSENDLNNDKERLAREIEMLIVASLVAFERDVDEMLPDRQACPLSRASIARSYATFLREIRCETKCKVDSFWAANKTSLKKLVDDGGQPQHRSNRGFADVLPNIQAATDDPKSQKTPAKCKRCGDVIIALDVPARLTLLTFDRSFESLCTILGKPVQRIPSLQDLKRGGTADL